MRAKDNYGTGNSMNRQTSKILGIFLIAFSFWFFIHSLQNRIKIPKPPPPTVSKHSLRITADQEKGKLYLWGLDENMIIQANVPIRYVYVEGFYVITIGDVMNPYTLNVLDGEKPIARFSYRPGEEYPIYPY